MKTDVIEIPIPEGHTASFDAKSGKITFSKKPKNVMERIKIVDDVLADNGLTQREFDELCENLDEDEVAYRIVKLLAKSLNEGWTPNWNNSSEPKYFPWFEMSGSSGFRYDGCDYWCSNTVVGSRLAFKSRELCEYAGKQFTDVYKQFMVIQ